jgi:hypothetical protein
MGIITNTASVTANEPDPWPGNNSATETTLVLEPPLVLVPEGLSSFALAQPKIFLHTQPICTGVSGSADGAASYESIGRVATYGSLTRFLRREPRSCADPGDIQSPILADSEYVYWMGPTGLMRLPTLANPGDQPGWLTDAVSGEAELAQDAASIYVLPKGGGRVTPLYRVAKANGMTFSLRTVPGDASSLSADGDYVYWLVGGTLQRHDLASGELATIAEGVSGYYAEGARPCAGEGCVTSHVFIGQGPRIVRHDNVDGSTSGPIYTAADASTEVYDLVGDGKYLYFLEEQAQPSPEDVIVRTTSAGDEVLTLGRLDTVSDHDAIGLALSADHLFLKYRGALHGYHAYPEQVTPINLHISDISVTQGIRSRLGPVILIAGRRTFVRMEVNAHPFDVPGVTAHLLGMFASPLPVPLGPLLPINDIGTVITVPDVPDSDNLNHSFWFELPLDWTDSPYPLLLWAELNPYHWPAEYYYDDNTLELSKPLLFEPSPRMPLWIVQFAYVHDNQWHRVSLVDELWPTLSWLRRVYPLASSAGTLSDPSPGLRERLDWETDNLLGEIVMESLAGNIHTWCQPHAYTTDNVIFCPSYYANQRLVDLRTTYGVGTDTYTYGMIAWPTGQPWAGQATDSFIKISSGPPSRGATGHEIGHTGGRAHSFDDPFYPYLQHPSFPTDTLALIGTGFSLTEGFDPGDPGLGAPRTLFMDDWITYDLMSYGFGNMWISDHTYECLYWMIKDGCLQTWCGQHASVPKCGGVQAATTDAAPAGVPHSGDWLSVMGMIRPGRQQAAISLMRRMDSTYELPTPGPGPYSMQLLDGQGVVLAEHPLAPYEAQDGLLSQLNFAHVVPFAPGTSQVQIAHDIWGVLGGAAVSPHAPLVSDVALLGAPDPVTGVVALGWQAQDPDGDALRFDVLYSADGGSSFQPLQLNVADTSTTIDTVRLGGSSSGRLRVVASDGSQTGYADSAPFRMAAKPPEMRILSPVDGAELPYGQLVNLSGEARDPQDGGVSGDGLVWSNQRGQLGSGSFLALTDLPVGVNWITLVATNTLGLSASASVAVTVTDDLDLPGPTLSVGPGRVGWHVSPGTMELQSAELSVANCGGGTLSWTAASDAAWLTAQPLAGTAPSTLTLSADPSGLAPGSLNVAVLTVRRMGESAQAVAVPVSLSVGNVWSAARQKTHLPLIMGR